MFIPRLPTQPPSPGAPLLCCPPADYGDDDGDYGGGDDGGFDDYSDDDAAGEQQQGGMPGQQGAEGAAAQVRLGGRRMGCLLPAGIGCCGWHGPF